MTTGPSWRVRISVKTGPTVSWSTTRWHIADMRAPARSNTLPAMAGLVWAVVDDHLCHRQRHPGLLRQHRGRREGLVDEEVGTVAGLDQVWQGRVSPENTTLRPA